MAYADDGPGVRVGKKMKGVGVVVQGAAHPEPAGRLGIPSNIGHENANAASARR